jgi:hypothetical protein
MALIPKVEITIEGVNTWQFNGVASCEIIEDMDTLTDTCTIELPKKIKWEGATGEMLPIKRGDKIRN